MKIEIDMDFGPYKKGQIIPVKADEGIPLNKYWRDRLRDAKYDNCCHIVKEETPTKKEAKSKPKKGEK